MLWSLRGALLLMPTTIDHWSQNFMGNMATFGSEKTIVALLRDALVVAGLANRTRSNVLLEALVFSTAHWPASDCGWAFRWKSSR